MSDYASIQKYRDEAKRSREAATTAYTPDARETFEEIARQYELLANAVQARLERR